MLRRLSVLPLFSRIGLLPMGLILGCAGSVPSEPGVDQVTRILQEYTVVDLAVTTRFFRFPAEPPAPFHPGELTKVGIDVAGLGIGSLTEILITGDFRPLSLPISRTRKCHESVCLRRRRSQARGFSGSWMPSTGQWPNSRSR